jgi:L-ascorbate metabolism protein UlaG (beta-lactamase superfamily)
VTSTVAGRTALRLTGLGLAAAGVAAGAAWLTRDLSAAFGAPPTGDRAERVRRSPQYRDGAFRNPAPTRNPGPTRNPAPTRALPPAAAPGGRRGLLAELLLGGQRRKPTGPVPVAVRPVHPRTPATGGLHITWYGHASALIDIEGRRVLVDPVWSDRCSPSTVVGPRRLHPVPVPVGQLPRLDAILISHDHYDHLDLATVRALGAAQSAPFLVPLGVGAHLDRWGVPAARIIELDWGESAEVAGLRLTATAAQHFSGRTLARDRTLWTSWVVAGPTRRVFYTGDSGYFDGYSAIGAAHGPFDATLVQIGAYDARWPDIHMTPEQGVAAHLDLRGGLLVPVHWATFVLAFHAWSEPVDRLWREARARRVAVAVPRPGERVDVDDPPPVDNWWQALS